MKVLFGVNALDSIRASAYLSHLVFTGYSYKQIPDLKFTFFVPERCSIDRMRNQAAAYALQNECDYLLFIDDDVIVEPETLVSLLDAAQKKGADIVMAETYVRGVPYNAMFFKMVGDKLEHYNDYERDADVDGLLECDAIGFSCALISCALLKKLSTPYFITGPNFTEDVFFCLKAKQEQPDTKIVVDTRVPTGHTLAGHYVHKSNVKAWREFGNKMLGEEPEVQKRDRSDQYAEEIENLFPGESSEDFGD